MDAEYCGNPGLPAAPLFAGKVDICDDHAGGMGVVDCGVEADILPAPAVAFGGPLPARLCSFGGTEGSILRFGAPRLAIISRKWASRAHVVYGRNRKSTHARDALARLKREWAHASS